MKKVVSVTSHINEIVAHCPDKTLPISRHVSLSGHHDIALFE